MKTQIITLLICMSSLTILGQEKQVKLLASNCELRGCSGSDYCTACKNCSGCAHCNSVGSCGVCSPTLKKKPIISKKRKVKRK